MSQNWHRMRGLANPTPALTPGGAEQNAWDPSGDVLLPDDHFARLHNPVNGRVPPQLPSPITRPRRPDFPMQQYERFFTLSTAAPLNHTLAFGAQTVRLDNYSSHWIYIRSAGVYVPPFIYGTIVVLDPAVNVAEWVISPPPGHTDSGSLESLVMTIWYECQQVPVTGFSVPST